jgi:hypothetical protein
VDIRDIDSMVNHGSAEGASSTRSV